MARSAEGDSAASLLGKLIKTKRAQARKLEADAVELEKLLALEDARQLGIGAPKK